MDLDLKPLSAAERVRLTILEERIRALQAELRPLLNEWLPLETRNDTFCSVCSRRYVPGVIKAFDRKTKNLVCHDCFLKSIEEQN